MFHIPPPDPYSPQKNISTGMDYTLSAEPHANYPDGAKKLTDNKLSPSSNFLAVSGSTHMKDFWVGFHQQAGNTVNIDVDLGKTINNLTAFELFTLQDKDAGIGLPGRIDIYCSTGGDYVHAGTHITPKTIGFQSKYCARIGLDFLIAANKVRFSISSINSSWLFIEELKIYTPGKEPVDEDNYFKKVIIPYISTPTYWDPSDTDYNTRKNMILGLSHQMRTDMPLEKEYQTEYYNMKETNPLLTDGKYAQNATYTDPNWFHCTRGFIREAIYTFEHTTATDGIRIGFLYDKPTGVTPPSWLEVIISEDGEAWKTVYTNIAITTGESNEILRIEGSFDKTYRTKYVIIRFKMAAHCYVDEIEVFGKKNVAGAASPEDNQGSTNKQNRFPKPGDIGGVRDVLLAYVNKSPDKKMTADKYLPQVAYYNSNNKAADWMFDVFMFLPDSSFKYKQDMLTKAQWEYFTDTVFINEGNMNTLNDAVGTAKKLLGRPDYKAGVIFSVPFPYSWVTDFGEIGGRQINMQDKEDRKLVLKWYIDHQIDVFKSKNYQNLKITGFYWFDESIYTSEPDLVEIIQNTNDYVRSLGYISSWIPYFQAASFELWELFRFDVALMQPNYAFNLNVGIERLPQSIRLSKKYGLGVELEINSLGHDYVNRMKDYYFACANDGAMVDVVHMYYLNAMPGAVYDSLNSPDPHLRSLYDSTYKFMKGTFASSLMGPDHFTIRVSKDIPQSGKLPGTPVDFVMYIDIDVAPQHGTIRVEPDGTYEYIPDYNYTGKDYFKVCYNYNFTKSYPAHIIVNIME